MKIEDYNEYYIQGSDHYLISKDAFMELFNEMENWREEAKELKKQLEEKENIACNWKDSCLENAGKIEILENQLKEFISYLEDKICIAGKVLDKPEEDEEVRGYVLARKFMLEEILSKYQEIIGGKE